MKKKNKTKKEGKTKSSKIKRFNLSKEKRITIISLLTLLIIASSYNAFASYQSPDIKEQIINDYSYTQKIEYKYQVYLKNNSLYDKKILSPGEGVFFKEIIDHIKINIIYDFEGSRDINLDGTYDVDYLISTNLWDKNYEIVKNKKFTTNSNMAQFTQNLEINITKYDDILVLINEETNTKPKDTNLIILTNVEINGDTNYKNLFDRINAEISIPLDTNIIQITNDLIKQKNGTIKIQNIVEDKEIDRQRTIYSSSSIGLFFALIFFVLLTKTEIDYDKKYLHDLKKIEKKYGEWIIKTTNKPPFENMKKIKVEKIEDLLKITEETSANIIQYQIDEYTNEFYVYQDNIIYFYSYERK